MATLRELLIERFSEEIKVLGQINLALTRASVQLQKGLAEAANANTQQTVNKVSVGPVNVVADVNVRLSLPEWPIIDNRFYS